MTSLFPIASRRDFIKKGNDMPRKYAISKRKINANLTGWQLDHLLHSYTMDQSFPFTNNENRKICWFQNRDFIIGLQGLKELPKSIGAFFTRKVFDYFERPAGWWDYEAPEMRRVIKGKIEIPGDACVWKDSNTFGKQAAVNWQDIEYESQKDYLMRVGVLNNAERKMMV